MDKKLYEDLLELRRAIESEPFQKYVLKPFKEYRQAQKNNFFSDSLKDSHRKGGRVEAVNEFLNILKVVDENFKEQLRQVDEQ